MSSSLLSKEYITDMLHRIQYSLTKKEPLANGLYEIWEREPPLQTMTGGSTQFYAMKEYVDMVFNKDKELKKEQQDSFQRLTQIREKAQHKDDENRKEREFKEENDLLAKNQQDIEYAKQSELEVEKTAEELHKQANEALIKSQEADKKIQEAKEEVEQAELNNQLIYESIQIRKQNVANSEKIMASFFKELENKELVSLEEITEAEEINEVVEEIKKVALSNILEKKTDDLLF